MNRTTRVVRAASTDARPEHGLVSLLSSLRVTLALLVLLGVVSALGTLVPATDDWSELRHFLVAGVGRVFMATGLDRPFSSSLFHGLLCLLMVNLALCTWRRLPGALREALRPSLPTQPAVVDGAEFRASLERRGAAPDELQDEIAGVMSSMGYAFVGAADGEAKARSILFRRGAWAPLGPTLTHLGVLVLFLGGVVGWRFGAEGYAEAPAGGSFDVQVPDYYRVQAELKRVHFQKDFIADLEREHDLRNGDVSEFRALERREHDLEEARERLGKSPLFTVRVVGAREEHYEGGDVRGWISSVEVQEAGAAVAHHDVSVNSPLLWRSMVLYQESFSWREAPGSDGARSAADDPARRVPWTGIGIQYDPGTPLVWLGSVCLLAGMALAFAVEQRRVVAFLDGQGRARLAGFPAKYPGLYRDEFHRIAEALRARVEGVAALKAPGGDGA